MMTVRSTASGAVNVSPGCCLRVVIRGHAVSGTATAEIPCKAPSNVASPGSLTKSVSHFLANAVTEAEAAMSESSKLQRTSAHFCQKVGHGVQLSVRKGGHEAACTEQTQRNPQQRLMKMRNTIRYKRPKKGWSSRLAHMRKSCSGTQTDLCTYLPIFLRTKREPTTEPHLRKGPRISHIGEGRLQCRTARVRTRLHARDGSA